MEHYVFNINMFYILVLETPPTVQERKLNCYAIQPALHCPQQPTVDHKIENEINYLQYKTDKHHLNTAHMHKLVRTQFILTLTFLLG